MGIQKRKPQKQSLWSMNFISRAVLSIMRNFGKTTLLLLIVFMLGIVMSGAISVQQAIQSTDANLRANMPAIAMMHGDEEASAEYERQTGSWPEVEVLSAEILHEVGALPYVKDYDISLFGMMESRDIERYIHDADIGSVRLWSNGHWEVVLFRGVHRASLVDINEGLIEIVYGRTFTEEEAGSLNYLALVSENFARLNNLHIGSTLTLEDNVWNRPKDEPITDIFSFHIEENIFAQRINNFEVIGIFSTHAEFDTGDKWTDAGNAEDFENRVYVPNAVIEESRRWRFEQERERLSDSEWAINKAEIILDFVDVYILNDPSDFPAFKAAVEEIVPPFWTVVNANREFDDIASNMQSLTGLAGTILWVAIGSAVVILTLLITLLLRERKREIGIYLALGEKRSKVIFQMMLEVMLVALVAVTLSLAVGNILAGNISETMLRNDLIAGQDSGSAAMYWSPLDGMGLGGQTPSVDEILAIYNVSLDATTVAVFFIAAIGTVLMATIAPMLYIVRLNPKKIML